jgi:uncharacterized membrane protein (DUF4010 family)
MARPQNGHGKDIADHQSGELSLLTLESPFSLTAVFKSGIIFPALGIAGALAQRAVGEVGFYAVCAVGGEISSASAVASAANLAAAGRLSPQAAGNGAVIASLMSAMVNLPLVLESPRTVPLP